MINIIEHLWQFQVQQSPIVPTAIKISQQKIKSYFYSQRQSRVLRKKEYGGEGVAVAMGMKEYPGLRYLVWVIKQGNTIEARLVLQNQVIQLAEDENTKCVIFGLETLKVKAIFECQLLAKNSHFEAVSLIELKQNGFVWSASQQAVEISLKQKLRGCTVKLLEKLLQKLNVQEQWKSFSLTIGLDQHQNCFYLWSNQLRWNKANFYQIDYHFAKHQAPLNSLNYSMGSSQYLAESVLPRSKKKAKKEEQILIQPKIQETTECKGCSKLIPPQKMTQIPNQDVIKLRRMNKLSIMGINKQYEEICLACCQLLDL